MSPLQLPIDSATGRYEYDFGSQNQALMNAYSQRQQSSDFDAGGNPIPPRQQQQLDGAGNPYFESSMHPMQPANPQNAVQQGLMGQPQGQSQFPPSSGGRGGGFGSPAGGQQNINLGQVGLTFSPNGNSGAAANGYNKWQFAQGGSIPQGLASLGRGQDSMLVHMTPGEVQGLQKLAMAHGGSLTINPQTGLPEAGILSTLLPMAAGFALGPAGFQLMSSLGAAATVGGLGALATGSLSKGLKYGLGAYGGSELGDSLRSMGADQANKLAVTDLEKGSAAATTTGNAAADTAFVQQAAKQTAALPEYGKQLQDLSDMGFSSEEAFNMVNPNSAFAQTPQQAADLARYNAADAYKFPGYSEATQKALDNPMRTGLGQLTEKGGMSALGSKLGYAGVAGLAAPFVSNMLQQPTVANLPKQNISRPTYDYRQGTVNPAFGQLGQPYFLDEGFTRTGAEGGLFHNTADAAYPQARLPLQHMAAGGLEDAQEYAAGGKLLRGAGDGMSDSIPAVIKGARPQRAALADGEFVIPADVVSHLGNGSTEAGAKRLYAMMDKVRHARTGNPKQGKQINPERFMPA